MPEFIDLGVSHDEKSLYAEMKEDGPKKSYPCVYISSPEPIDFDDDGTAEIKYRVVEKTEHNREGKEEYRYELEVHGVKPLETEEIEEEEMPKKMAKKSLTQNLGSILEKVEARRGSGDY